MLIAVDDEANQLVARDYVGGKEPRILYVSLNRPPADYGYPGAPNVSGIAESLPFAGIKDALTTIFPGHPPTVSVIGADSITGRAEMDQVRAFNWGSVKILGSQLVSTAGAWRDFISTAGTDALWS